MLNLIPTPNFAEINEAKTLNVKSIVINEADINRDAIDDFYAFLSKINIQNGNGSQKNVAAQVKFSASASYGRSGMAS